jgi:NADH-quinone oxidoreductase subunit L
MARQWKTIFWGDYESPTDHHTTPLTERIPLFVLAGLSVFVWFSWNPLNADSSWLFRYLNPVNSEEVDALPLVAVFHYTVPVVSVLIAFLGGWLGYVSVGTEVGWFQKITTFYQTIKATFEHWWLQIKHWFMLLRQHDEEQTHTLFLIVPLQKIAHWVSWFDQRLIDTTVNGLGYLTVIVAHIVGRIDRMVIDGTVNGLAWVTGFVGNRTRNLQNGRVQSYFVVMLVGVLLLMFWILK